MMTMPKVSHVILLTFLVTPIHLVRATWGRQALFWLTARRCCQSCWGRHSSRSSRQLDTLHMQLRNTENNKCLCSAHFLLLLNFDQNAKHVYNVFWSCPSSNPFLLLLWNSPMHLPSNFNVLSLLFLAHGMIPPTFKMSPPTSVYQI